MFSLPILQGITKVYVLSIFCWILLLFWTPKVGLPSPTKQASLDDHLLFNTEVMKLSREVDSTLRQAQVKVETVQLQHKELRRQRKEMQELINQSYVRQYLEMGTIYWPPRNSGDSLTIFPDKGKFIFPTTPTYY